MVLIRWYHADGETVGGAVIDGTMVGEIAAGSSHDMTRSLGSHHIGPDLLSRSEMASGSRVVGERMHYRAQRMFCSKACLH